MNKPNFFIVGMPRAGTTFLHRHLARHPDIYMSEDKCCPWHGGKEPHFFGSDLTPLQCPPRLSEKEYLALFNATNKKIIGESSTSYIISAKAVDEIYDFSPQAKIIISIRNPVDQCYSLYNLQTASIPLSVGDNKAASFEQSMADDPGMLRSTAWFVENNFYARNIKNLPERIRHFQRTFGEQNVKIVVYDDVRAAPEKVYREILTFLGVDVDFLPPITAQHTNRVFVRQWLAPFYRFLKSITILRSIKNKLLPNHYPAEMLFFKTAPRASLPAELRDRFIKEFTPVVEELENITGRDLSAWKQISPL